MRKLLRAWYRLTGRCQACGHKSKHHPRLAERRCRDEKIAALEEENSQLRRQYPNT
jgi:hypothetical protein